MTKVIFVRHAEAEGNVNRNFHGHYDSAVTENGRKQLEVTARRLKNEHIDVIYSSDLTRTFETAKAIAQGRRLEITKDERLREIFGGQWEDVPWDELPIRFPESYGFWLNNPLYLRMPGGESMVEFQQRVLDAVYDIVQKNTGKVICIATHGTVIKVLLCKYSGKTLSDLPEMTWHDNASITIVEFDENLKPEVTAEGDNAHLGKLSTLEKQSWWRKKYIEGEMELE